MGSTSQSSSFSSSKCTKGARDSCRYWGEGRGEGGRRGGGGGRGGKGGGGGEVVKEGGRRGGGGKGRGDEPLP